MNHLIKRGGFYAYLRRFCNADNSIGKSKGRCGQKHNGGQPWDRACKAGQEGFACGCRQPRESDGNAWLAAAGQAGTHSIKPVGEGNL